MGDDALMIGAYARDNDDLVTVAIIYNDIYSYAAIGLCIVTGDRHDDRRCAIRWVPMAIG